jgi:hypothetical protein
VESIPGLHKSLKIRALAIQAGGIDSSASIPGPLKSLKFGLRTGRLFLTKQKI